METADSLLVDRCCAGDRDAFGQIVQRYQTLICSIAYSVTGNFAASEELAQEAFVTAWKSIRSLQDPSRLRAWLCGIVRNLANNRLRKRNKDVLSNAADLDKSQSATSNLQSPLHANIQREEQELLNRTLASMPEKYREPLVLYYREEQSVAAVAEQLELSPSAVKQRLARGRQMLREEVASIIERGLMRTAPGVAFTAGVLAALPAMSGTAKAATVTITSAKGVSSMSSGAAAGLTGAILGPIAGLLGGWFGYKMSMKSARSDQERDFIRNSTMRMLVFILLFGVVLGGVLLFSKTIVAWNPRAFTFSIASLIFGYMIVLAGLIARTNSSITRIRKETGTFDLPTESVAQNSLAGSRVYDSKIRLLGLPLVSVRLVDDSSGSEEYSNSAVGWIAIGGQAYGLIAFGGVAVGAVAVGGIGVGLISIGGLALGCFAYGGCAIGWAACGGAALGWMSLGGVAISWKAALGGLAASLELAQGGLAIGPHANDEVAKAFFESSNFFRYGMRLMTPWGCWGVLGLLMAPYALVYKYVPPFDLEE